MTGIPVLRAARCAAVLVAGLALALPAARADEGDPPWTRHPGYVSGKPFLELAGDEGELVEVSVTGALLNMVASSVRGQDRALGDMIAGLAALSAVVVEVPRDASDALEKAERAMVARLEAGGWNAIARIRDGESRVTVWVLPRGERLLGLTVLVRDGRDLVFTNIAGTIDMEKLQSLAGRLDLPGLEALEGAEITDGKGEGDAPRR